MTTDRYTKVVLTIIALSLSIIAIQLTSKEAHANQQAFRFNQDGLLMITTCNERGTSSFICSDGRIYYHN
jgi:glucose uptake protein GlcU